MVGWAWLDWVLYWKTNQWPSSFIALTLLVGHLACKRIVSKRHILCWVGRYTLLYHTIPNSSRSLLLKMQSRPRIRSDRQLCQTQLLLSCDICCWSNTFIHFTVIMWELKYRDQRGLETSFFFSVSVSVSWSTGLGSHTLWSRCLNKVICFLN